jgi:hypothetical protein
MQKVYADASFNTKIKTQRPPLPPIVLSYALLCLAFGLYFLNNCHDYWNYNPYGIGTDSAHQLLAAGQFLFAFITLSTAMLIFFRSKKAWGGVWAVTCIALDWVCNDIILCRAYGGALTDCPAFPYVLIGACVVIVQVIFATWFTFYWRGIASPLSAIKKMKRLGVVLLVVAGLVAYVNWDRLDPRTKYREYGGRGMFWSNSDRFTLDVINKLRPMYRPCTTAELLAKAPVDCSAVIVSGESFELQDWEVPEGTETGSGLVNSPAISQVSEIAKKYNVPVGGRWNSDASLTSVPAWCSYQVKWLTEGHWTDDWHCPEGRQATPPPSVQLSPETAEHIRGSVARPWDVLPELQGLLRHVFGSDVAKFELATNGPGELRLNGDDAFFHFCKAHDCPDHESVLVVNLSNGRAAGALVDTGSLYTYEGDYPSDALPDNLKAWLKENTQK